MKNFSWIQSKINGSQRTSKPNPVTITYRKLHQPCKEEFSDWPNELLAIGTFGNKSPKDAGNLNQPEGHLTPEEVGQLHKELKHLIHEKIPPSTKGSSKEDLEKFFDCLQNLEDDKAAISSEQQVVENSENKESKLKRSNSIVRGRGQDHAQLENTNSGISKKSLSYLLKKTFLCGGGFTSPPPHPLIDPITHSKYEKSRMEKILRAILHKKIYPQASSPRGRTTGKRYLGNRIESDSKDEACDSVKDGNKWDKSDSDYIVLEI